MTNAPFDPHHHSWQLQRTSATLRREAATLVTQGRALIQRGRELRERIQKFLQPPPPTSTA